MLKTNLPDSIELPNATLYPVIGGHLKGRPFLTLEHSGVDVTRNGWGSDLIPGTETALIIAEAKRQGLKYRRVKVLARGLRGKLDLHRHSYQPTSWVFVEFKRYQVTRNCCTSGNCIKCITARRDNPAMKRFEPIRVIQLDNLTKEKAEVVARNFREYDARVEPQTATSTTTPAN